MFILNHLFLKFYKSFHTNNNNGTNNEVLVLFLFVFICILKRRDHYLNKDSVFLSYAFNIHPIKIYVESKTCTIILVNGLK